MKKSNKPPSEIKKTVPSSAGNLPLANHQQTQKVVVAEQYSGQIPPPELLERFDRLQPGTAGRLIQWAEDEQNHRRRLESEAQAANIDAQKRQLQIAELQSRGALRSDLVGQSLGFVVCCLCVAGAVYLGFSGYSVVAVALAAIPTGAVIMSFRSNIFKAGKPD